MSAAEVTMLRLRSRWRTQGKVAAMAAAVSLIAALALIAANAFFVAVEFALVATDRTEAELAASRGDRRAAVVAASLRKLSLHLSGVQLGITVCSVLLGFLAEPALASLLRPALTGVMSERASERVALILALALATVLQMVLAELVPKAIAVSRPYPTARRLARANQIYSVTFGPIIRLFSGAADRAVRRLGIEPTEELSTVRSRSEMVRLVRTSSEGGTLERDEAMLLERVFRFGEKTVADVLTPRTDVVALSATATGADLIEHASRTGLSRFPVTSADVDDVVGVVAIKSLLTVDAASRREAAVTELMDEPMLVPESLDLDTLLLELRDRALTMAVVLDEYGGTAGIVTLEDLLEEIVGEIDDEYDRSSMQRRPTIVDEVVLSGGLHPDEVFESCGFVMPDGDFDTLAGLLLDRIGAIPAPGDSVEIDDWTFEVLAMDRRRIAEIRVAAPDVGDAT